ncbi:MAG: hypothetical protein HRU26_13010 [Psychroserpens sp.]|nr:hypothetical protein [Psychroserpens sp.]
MKTLFLFIAGCLAFNAYSQTVHIVDNNQGAGAQYTSVQAAVDAAAPGDIIYLQPSPNGYGDINMTKPLNIYGIGYTPELNSGQRATVSNILFRSADASGSKISGLRINGIFLDNTTFNNHDVVITNNYIGQIIGNNSTSAANNAIISGNHLRNPNFRCIYVLNSQNWIISHNTIHQTNTSSGWGTFEDFNASTIFNNNIVSTRQNGDGNQAILLFNSCSGSQISNNIFLFTGNNVTNFTSSGGNNALNFQNNLTFNYNGTLDLLSGMNNLDNTDPQFVNINPSAVLSTTTNDFNIQAGSPAENAGADGNDLGVENGSFPFDNRGYPTELPYLTDFVIFNNIISPGTPLNINIKADANINN